MGREEARKRGYAIGRWETSSSVRVDGLQDVIMDILREYGDVVYEATEEGLAAAEKILINNLKAATPKKTGTFSRGWKGTGKKYKLVRFVGNTTTVPGGKGKRPIALSNIFEYSTTRGKPFIKKTFESSINEIAAAVVAEIKKGV
jgi:hypothetical protein